MNHGHYFQSVELSDFGALRVSGPDATRFLQGQLSNDLTQVTPSRSALSGYHNPQGRTIAVLRLVQLDDGDLLALLPRELAPTVAARLSKYVLRSKVSIADESSVWRISGLIAAALEGGQRPGVSRPEALRAAALAAIPRVPDMQRRVGNAVVICLTEEPARWLVIRPAGQSSEPVTTSDALPEGVSAPRDLWRQLDIIGGVPQIYTATSEEFVAQMLNLDVLGAVAFDKGCYTGQEVIARAHYRGRVKRRLQRFRSRGPLELAPGDSGALPDGRVFRVIDAVRLADGRCEFLAVAPMPGAEPEHGAQPQPAVPSELTVTGAVWAPFATSPGAPARAAEPLRPTDPTGELPHELERLELPYALPE